MQLWNQRSFTFLCDPIRVVLYCLQYLSTFLTQTPSCTEMKKDNDAKPVSVSDSTEILFVSWLFAAMGPMIST
jgi:hypothetical protein